MHNYKERTFTPENITELGPLDVFVFGSNLNGRHAGGAARLAAEKFGAIEGRAEGLQGRSYAIPTLGRDMQRLPLEEIEAAVGRFLDFADKHPEYHFLLTKIGCGIAGFTVEEIAPIFLKIDWTYRFNISVPQEFCVIRGVKGFGKDMQCRGKQYYEGVEAYVDGPIECCSNGIHFCENPAQVFSYYPAADSIFAQVEGRGSKDSHCDDSKIAVSCLKVGAVMDVGEVVSKGVEHTRKRSDFFIRRSEAIINLNSGLDGSVNSGRNRSVNSGLDSSVNSGLDGSVNSGRNRSVNSGRNRSVNSGLDSSVNSGLDWSVNSGRDGSVNSGLDSSVNSGRDSSVNSGRNRSVNSGLDWSVNSGLDSSVNSGLDGSVNSGLDSSVNSGLDGSVNSGRDGSVNSGRDWSVCAGRYDSTINLEGKKSFGIAGKGSRIKGKIGCAICLVDCDDLGNIIDVQAAIVDGVKIREDVYYILKDGRFSEATGHE